MPKLNKDQQAVVDYSSGQGALLVTAAAGSGKTAVVVERVIGLITRKEDPVDISRLLVITFTNAAAEEMRTRITAALREKLKENPGNRRLAREIKLLGGAEITTIDSFLLRLVRDSFHKLGISPDARIADQSEADGLSERVMEDLLEEKYTAADPGFLALVEMLTKGQKDQTLPELIRRTYESFQSMPHPERKLMDAARLYQSLPEDVSQTIWVSYLLQKARKTVDGYIKKYQTVIRDIQDEPKLAKYDFMLRDLLREKQHVLSKEEENILAQLSEVTDAPESIYTMLSNADMKFGTILDEDGDEVELTHGNYIKFMKSHDRGVRQSAFERMYETYKSLLNTISTAYSFNVKNDVVGARIRRYDSARAAALSGGNIPEEVYDNLI
ncbi:MAG: UvrD-helicase domain-containing protein, partial [Clostridia bacterium]|nr:UvrD-helicase domain-containing protein [Clostridia bacterium]